MIRTLLFAGIAAFVGKKLYDRGTLDPYIAEARKQLKTAFPDTGARGGAPLQSAGSRRKSTAPSSFTPPPQTQVPAG